MEVRNFQKLCHVQQIYAAAASMGYHFTPYERKPFLWDGQTETPIRFPGWLDVLYNRRGFITGHLWSSGSGHAVAWNGERIYDPVGLIYELREAKIHNFRPDTFHLLIPESKRRQKIKFSSCIDIIDTL